MRRSSTARIAAVALVAALGLGGLAACSGDGAGDGTTPSPTATGSASVDSAADEAALAAVEVTGDAGAKPTITLPDLPFAVTSQVARLVDDGTGDAVSDGDLVRLHVLAVQGSDGTELGNTWDADTPQYALVSATSVFPALYELLASAKVGTRILLAAPNSSDTAVEVLEVASTGPGRAQGSPVAPALGLPTVTLDDTGKPSLTTVDVDPPSTLVVQETIHGTGATVAAGDSVMVKYTGWLWDGTQFDSSWDRGDTYVVDNVGQASVIAGWNQGLVGLNVGSQAILVVPPDLGYGDAGSGDTIPGGATLVFVIDVLASAAA